MSSEATRISPPHEDPTTPDQCLVYVEFAGNLYRVTGGNGQTPNLVNFPIVDNPYRVEPIELSQEVNNTLRQSSLLDHGAHGFIREDLSHSLPIIKMALPDSISRARLAYEFQMLQKLHNLMIPTPRFGSEPLTDSDGIYGYRMERLQKLDFDNLKPHRSNVERLLQCIHSKGVTFGDFHPGNIMQNDRGNLVVIDPGCAGLSGETVPSIIEPYIYDDPHFHEAVDKRMFAQWFS